MSVYLSRGATRALLAIAITGALTGLAVGPASASDPSMRVKVCNATQGTEVVWTWVSGTNQDGKLSTTPGAYLGRYGACHTFEGYWWKIGSWADVGYNTNNEHNQQVSYKVSGSDGGVNQINLGYVV